MIVPSPVGRAEQVCLDENDDVWDVADQFESLVDAMTTLEFCRELRIDNATEFMARPAGCFSQVAGRSVARLGELQEQPSQRYCAAP